MFNDPVEFRRAVSRFTTGITIVSTAEDGVDHAMTVSSFASVSLSPLLVLFCPEKVSRFHDVVLRTGQWAVSVLGSEARAASQWFATRGRPLEGQLDGWAFERGEKTGAAIMGGAIAALECRTHAVHDGGDHSIVVGEVLSARHIGTEPVRPLAYYESTYRTLSAP